ncbi:hypothetical protein E4U54_002006 [Claviceps lovelessii]|nr:hypothetical protein E4U54_002006 [Claviceps lovelessii]
MRRTSYWVVVDMGDEVYRILLMRKGRKKVSEVAGLVDWSVAIELDPTPAFIRSPSRSKRASGMKSGEAQDEAGDQQGICYASPIQASREIQLPRVLMHRCPDARMHRCTGGRCKAPLDEKTRAMGTRMHNT